MRLILKREDISLIKQPSCELPLWNSIQISKSEALQGSSFSLVCFSLSGYKLLELFWQLIIIGSAFKYLSKEALSSIVIPKPFS